MPARRVFKRRSWANDDGVVGAYDESTKRNTARNGRVFKELLRASAIRAAVRETLRRLAADEVSSLQLKSGARD